MSIASYIKEIGAPDHHLAMRDLRPLSGLGFDQRRDFLEAWATIVPERRAEIVRAMVDLVEDNVDLDFNAALFWMLDDADAGVRATALEGLWEDASARLLRRLLAMIQTDPAPEVRAAAALLLGRFAYLSVTDELPEEDSATLEATLIHMMLDQEQPFDVRRRALEAAGYFSDEDVVQREIERFYASDDQLLRESALVAMGRSMQPRWLPTISAALGSASPALRYEAARAAGEMAEEARGLLARLVPLIDTSDSEVALAAIWALGQIGGDAARRTLQRMRKSADETRRQAAEEALEELSIDESLLG
jgi:HEAT repeat protein